MSNNLKELIRALESERKELEAALVTLGKLDALRAGRYTPPELQPSRRGRKSMNPEERKEVSQRMRKYWADQRRLGPSDTERLH